MGYTALYCVILYCSELCSNVLRCTVPNWLRGGDREGMEGKGWEEWDNECVTLRVAVL